MTSLYHYFALMLCDFRINICFKVLQISHGAVFKKYMYIHRRGLVGNVVCTTNYYVVNTKEGTDKRGIVKIYIIILLYLLDK